MGFTLNIVQLQDQVNKIINVKKFSASLIQESVISSAHVKVINSIHENVSDFLIKEASLHDQNQSTVGTAKR